MQQIVYGWYKEKSTLKVRFWRLSNLSRLGCLFYLSTNQFLQCFIDVFYGENASRVLRVDMTMYTILAYLAVFRLEELGLSKFKELCATEV